MSKMRKRRPGAGFPQKSRCCRLPEDEPGLPKKRRYLQFALGVIDSLLIDNENWQLWGHAFRRGGAGRMRVFYATHS
jgi:hypothetical protein